MALSAGARYKSILSKAVSVSALPERRSLADVRTMLQHSDFIFGIIAPDSQQLLAFARVLTDRVFKALLLDVIVHPEYRSDGPGSFLMVHIIANPVISRVRHIELYFRYALTFTGVAALLPILETFNSCAAPMNFNRTKTPAPEMEE